MVEEKNVSDLEKSALEVVDFIFRKQYEHSRDWTAEKRYSLYSLNKHVYNQTISILKEKNFDVSSLPENYNKYLESLQNGN